MQNYFDLSRFENTPDWNGIVLGIEHDCATSYKRRKGKLKKHFDEVGGYEDVERARRHPPRRMAPKAWEKVIDKLFITEKYKRRSEQNTENKAKQPYGSSHGCEPFAQKRYKEVRIFFVNI